MMGPRRPDPVMVLAIAGLGAIALVAIIVLLLAGVAE